VCEALATLRLASLVTLLVFRFRHACAGIKTERIMLVGFSQGGCQVSRGQE